MKKRLIAISAALMAHAMLFTPVGAAEDFKVLLFTKTAGYRHPSIPHGIAAITKLGAENNFGVTPTEDSALFTEENLGRYSVVVFLNTSGNILDPAQKAAFTKFIQAGGGFVGVHAATDTEHAWPWYEKFIGAQFVGHPAVQQATLRCEDHDHMTTRGLPKDWVRTDEWYNFRNISPDIHTLYRLDETTYSGGANGENHPASWCQEFDGGRMFYTCGGHTPESYSEPDFVRHILLGIRYAAGSGKKIDHATQKPDDIYFDSQTLVEDLNDPMEISVAADGRVFIAERTGAVKLHQPKDGKTYQVGKIDVMYRERPGNPDKDYAAECGLIGITLDPGFMANGWIYLHYAAVSESKTRVARFTFKDGKIDPASEKILFDYPTDREKITCHEGGSMAFGPGGCLYVSIGDNTCPFASAGYAPLDERPDRKEYDAQRSAGNSNDLRGSVLRVKPTADGGYTIPEGNLFKPGTANARPEIYAMGCRNPFRISVDPKTGNLFWGEVGPDANGAGNHGAMGFDEINMATEAGFFGWPYFIGDNQPYGDVDFGKNQVGALFENGKTVNDSPNNTGIRTLPAATSALIWYPYGKSEQFPEMGGGGRSAMAGPLCRWNPRQKHSLPKYMDGKLIIYEWMRNTMLLVTIDGQNKASKLEPLFRNQSFRHPMDMEQGPDGELYVLEYGGAWLNNTNGSLKRITYQGTSIKPSAHFSVSTDNGRLPLVVRCDSGKSYDKDPGDTLRYQWTFAGDSKVQSTEANPTFTFGKAGDHVIELKLTDGFGLSDTHTQVIHAGNSRAAVVLKLAEGSERVHWGEAVKYAVEVSDPEDGRYLSTAAGTAGIRPDQVKVSAEFVPKVAVSAAATGSQSDGLKPSMEGTALIAGSTCLACHQVRAQSVGPSYEAVALKYKGDTSAPGRLALKVIQGGVGTWGHTPMPPQAQHTPEQARLMIEAILAVEPASQTILGKDGALQLPPQPADQEANQGHFRLTASYLDKGAPGAMPILAESAGIDLVPKWVTVIGKDTRLDYRDAVINGDGPRITGEGIGYYNNPKATLGWTARFAEPGEYEVYLSQALPAPHEGTTYHIAIGDQKVTGTIQATGDWNSYKEIPLGKIKVSGADLQTIEFVPDVMKKTVVANIQAVRFKKVR